MVKRTLGKTGIQVSKVAFGCVEIGMPYGIGVRSANDMLSESDAVRLLQTALKAGINFFDTARAYGTSENIIGKAFKNCRSDVIIVTKCSHFLNTDGSVPAYQQLKQIIESSLHQSLLALQTDYIDIYMLHNADANILHNEDVKTVFRDLKQSGVIRATGISTYTNEQTEMGIDAGVWDVIQVPFNMMDQRQSVLFDKAHNCGVGIVIRSVLLKGLLSDRGKNLHPALSAVEQHIGKYDSLATTLGLPLSVLATRFALSFPQVSAILVGIDKEEYLEQSLIAANGQYLNNELFTQAKALAYPDPVFLDLPKWDREGWLK